MNDEDGGLLTKKVPISLWTQQVMSLFPYSLSNCNLFLLLFLCQSNIWSSSSTNSKHLHISRSSLLLLRFIPPSVQLWYSTTTNRLPGVLQDQCPKYCKTRPMSLLLWRRPGDHRRSQRVVKQTFSHRTEDCLIE